MSHQEPTKLEDKFWRAAKATDSTRDFANRLFEGTASDVIALDELIVKHSENWRLERLAIIDRAILRLALYELRATDTPPKVVLNEAVDLAKKIFGNLQGKTVYLVGAGKMGGAMAQGWLDAGLAASSLTILEPKPSPEIASLAASRGIALNPQIAAPPEVLVLATKPQSLDQVAPGIAAIASARTLVLSILAGKTIADLTARLPQARAVVRAMPNLPAAIGRGVTGAFANANVTGEQRRWCERLLGAVGAFYWLDDESATDAVTAISGSGPAYIFALTEALAAAAERLGLEPELSMGLARGTVEGAAELMRRDSKTSPATLRRSVTSPVVVSPVFSKNASSASRSGTNHKPLYTISA